MDSFSSARRELKLADSPERANGNTLARGTKALRSHLAEKPCVASFRFRFSVLNPATQDAAANWLVVTGFVQQLDGTRFHLFQTLSLHWHRVSI